MSFLAEYKQRLADKLAAAQQQADEEQPQPQIMHKALAAVVAERTERAEATQELIIDTFGWDAASTVEECADVWNAASLYERSLAASDRVGEMDWAKQAAADSTPAPREMNARVKSQRAEAQPNQATRLGQRKTFGSEPKVGDMVIMQGGIGRIVDQDGSNGNVMIKGQKGDERVFPRDQIIGPKQVNGKTAWALKTALPTRG